MRARAFVMFVPNFSKLLIFYDRILHCTLSRKFFGIIVKAHENSWKLIKTRENSWKLFCTFSWTGGWIFAIFMLFLEFDKIHVNLSLSVSLGCFGKRKKISRIISTSPFTQSDRLWDHFLIIENHTVIQNCFAWAMLKF